LAYNKLNFVVIATAQYRIKTVIAKQTLTRLIYV